MNRLILLVESRIRGDVYVRFGGELPKTHRSNTAGRWMLSLPLKSVNNLVKDARKVQQTILMVGFPIFKNFVCIRKTCLMRCQKCPAARLDNNIRTKSKRIPLLYVVKLGRPRITIRNAKCLHNRKNIL